VNGNVKRLAVANGPNIFQMLLVSTGFSIATASAVRKARIPRHRHRLPCEDPRRHVRHARLKLFLWQAERHADILVTIYARMSVSESWNSMQLNATAVEKRSRRKGFTSHSAPAVESSDTRHCTCDDCGEQFTARIGLVGPT